jgi:hypothetical protein
MTTLDRLATIIPADQALANKALAVSLQQITGIKNILLPTFAATVKNTQTMVGLPLVNAQTSAVPPAAAAYYNTLAGGSSSNGTYVISDFLGSAAGIPGTQVLTDTLTLFSQMNLSYLTLIYQTMANVLNGTYNQPNYDYPPDTFYNVVIPAGLPAAGTYEPTVVPYVEPVPPPVPPVTDPWVETESAASKVMPILIADANAEIVNLVAAYPTQTTQLNQLWTKLASSTANEPANQAKAGLVWNQLIANSQSSLLSLIQSLPDYGKDTAEGGQAQFFEAMADKTTLAGQAIIGLFRQGVTTRTLNSAGIYTNNNIPSDPNPPPPQANLGPTS